MVAVEAEEADTVVVGLHMVAVAAAAAMETAAEEEAVVVATALHEEAVIAAVIDLGVLDTVHTEKRSERKKKGQNFHS